MIEIKVCMGSSCYARGNEDTRRVIEDYIARHNLHDKVDFRGCLCTGRCGEGPNIEIAGRAYQRVDAGVLLDILDRVFAHREDAQ